MRNGKINKVRDEMKRRDPDTSEWKPVRPYRSEAERVAVTQRNVQIGLSIVILLIGVVNLLVQTNVI